MTFWYSDKRDMIRKSSFWVQVNKLYSPCSNHSRKQVDENRFFYDNVFKAYCDEGRFFTCRGLFYYLFYYSFIKLSSRKESGFGPKLVSLLTWTHNLGGVINHRMEYILTLQMIPTKMRTAYIYMQDGDTIGMIWTVSKWLWVENRTNQFVKKDCKWSLMETPKLPAPQYSIA